MWIYSFKKAKLVLAAEELQLSSRGKVKERRARLVACVANEYLNLEK